jgi:hypothetical protein
VPREEASELAALSQIRSPQALEELPLVNGLNHRRCPIAGGTASR